MFLSPYNSYVCYLLNVLIFGLFYLGCGSTDSIAQAPISQAKNLSQQNLISEHVLPLKKATINLVIAGVRSIATDATDFALPAKPLHLKPEYAVARQIVDNYYKSENKNPGGNCLTISKSRFAKAYKDVYGHSFREDLPDAIATKELTPQQVFRNLFTTATKSDPEWRNLPREYRAKGNAGAIALAGLGKMIDTEGIWSGKLRPGALVQVWWLREDYEKVRRGIEVKNFDPYGHSFVFLGYELDRMGAITGMRIADQGFQSYRPLVPRDYEVWWGVNLQI